MTSAIYAIRNTLNEKRYIGSAVSVDKRFENHLRRLRDGRHHSLKLQHAWDHYGECVFVFEIVEIISDRSALIPAEQHWMDHYRAAGVDGYNVNPVANSQHGRVWTPEQRMRNARAQRGRKHPPHVKAKISAAHRGKTVSPETRAKLAKAKTGKPIVLTPEAHARQSERTIASNRARIWTAEARSKVRASRIGKPPDLQQMALMWRKNQRRVKCVTRDQVFDSVKEAAASYGISSSAVSNVCAGRERCTHGLVFELVNAER